MLFRELDGHLPTWPGTTKDDDRIGVRTLERVLRWPDEKLCAERQEQCHRHCDNCQQYPGPSVAATSRRTALPIRSWVHCSSKPQLRALLSAHDTTIARLIVDSIEATVEHKSGMWPKVAVVAELRAPSSLTSDIAPIGVISPHMDDAALSCGRLLSARPGSHVVTVFSGGPESVRPLPTWDEMSGSFKPGDNVMSLRQLEDEDAMAVVGAYGHRLDFWDEQYRAGRPIRLARLRPRALRAARARLGDPALESSVEQRLRGIVAEIALETWLIPLGLWHGDHKMTARACLRVARHGPERRWVVYEELPYRLEVPLEVTAAKQRIQANGFGIDPSVFPSSDDASKKRDMVNAYRSQIPCLGHRADVAVDNPEVFHLLTREPSDGGRSSVVRAPAPRAP